MVTKAYVLKQIDKQIDKLNKENIKCVEKIKTNNAAKNILFDLIKQTESKKPIVTQHKRKKRGLCGAIIETMRNFCNDEPMSVKRIYNLISARVDTDTKHVNVALCSMAKDNANLITRTGKGMYKYMMPADIKIEEDASFATSEKKYQ